MSQNEKAVTEDAKGRRSPISPILPIDEAIEKARLVYDKDKRALTDFPTLAGHLGYKVEKKGGRSGRTVSTLKQYGLLDERDGKYRISEAAWKILEMPEDSPERARLVREAAFRPPMIRKIFRINEGELPSDATLRSHLMFSEGFNKDSAVDFIRVLRRTKDLVNPSPVDYNAGEEPEGADAPTGATPMQQPPPKQQQAPPGFPVAVAQQRAAAEANEKFLPQYELRYPISRDTQARIIFIGSEITQEAIEKLRVLLEHSKDTFPTKAELEQPKEVKPRAVDEDEKALPFPGYDAPLS